MIKNLLVAMFGLALLAPFAAAQEPFLGEIDAVAFNFAPQGWALCQGQIMSISQNQALFSLLGTTYGGNGVSTFALPDLRGRRIVGWGQSSTGTFYNLGQTGGEEAVTLTVGQTPPHSHSFVGSTGAGSLLSPAGNVWAAQSQTALYYSGPGSASMSPAAVGTAGGGQPHDNMPSYLTLNYIIALQGIYPARN
jgi:microcystin-dependent protein